MGWKCVFNPWNFSQFECKNFWYKTNEKQNYMCFFNNLHHKKLNHSENDAYLTELSVV